MAGLLRGKALSQMKETVEAIAARVEKEKTTMPAELKRQVGEMQKALGTAK
jgi:hypothetical protein